ncbi:MAG: DUF3552 domain-containing protein, partial [Flavobacteriales bacterium]|nr:DUF3552 domain-containing protein [Flavobacteriales bacterium]
MDFNIVSLLIGALVGLVAGGAVVFAVLNGLLKKRREEVLKEAEAEGEAIKKEKIVQAKEKFLQLKDQHENEVRNRERKIQQLHDKAKQREKQLGDQQKSLSHKEKDMDGLKADLQQKMEGLDRRREEVEKMHQKQVDLLEKVSGMNADDARKHLVESLKDEARTAAMAHIKEVQEEAKLTANKEAKRIVVQT